MRRLVISQRSIRESSMPQILIAGFIHKPPQILLFPEQGRPRVEFHVRVKAAEIYPVVAYDTHIPEAELLVAGDALSVVGELVLKKREISHLVASQITPLRRRSINRLPVHMVMK